MKKIVFLFLLAMSIPLLGCQNTESSITPSGNVVKIAFLAPLSGPGGNQGQSALLGVRIALKVQPYLDSGDKVEVVIEDYQGNPTIAAAMMGKLCTTDDISGVLLLAGSDLALEVAPLAEHYKTPVLALNATHLDITKGRHFISQLGVDDIFQETVAALYIRDELLVDRVAVFSNPENSHFALLAAKFTERFESVGGHISEHITSRPDDGDYQKILERLQKNKTQLLYLVLEPESILRIATAAKEIGWQPKMMGSDGLLSSIMLEHPHEIALVDGMMATDFYSASLPQTAYGKKVAEIYNNRFTTPGTTYTALACEGTSIFMNALSRCMDKSSKSCVNSMLRDTKDFEGLFGAISINAEGRAERPLFVNVFEGRHLKFLVKVY